MWDAAPLASGLPRSGRRSGRCVRPAGTESRIWQRRVLDRPTSLQWLRQAAVHRSLSAHPEAAKEGPRPASHLSGFLESGHTRNSSSAGSKARGGSSVLLLRSAKGREPDACKHLQATADRAALVPRSAEASLPRAPLSMVRQPETRPHCSSASRGRAPSSALVQASRPGPAPWCSGKRCRGVGGAGALVPRVLLLRLLFPQTSSAGRRTAPGLRPLVGAPPPYQTTN